MVVILPHTHPESPFTMQLSATAGDALTLVLVGDGRHATTTLDYGSTFHDALKH